MHYINSADSDGTIPGRSGRRESVFDVAKVVVEFEV